MSPGRIVACAALVAWLPSLAGAFQFDDYNVIVDYPTVHSWQAFFERAGDGVRPLLKASYVLNWTSGAGLTGFHLFNIAVHAANAVLLLRIGETLVACWGGAGRGAAFVAALLFALHPAQTEAVTYLSGRSASFMALPYLAALLVSLRGGRAAWVALLFLAAVAIKETAVTLPAALLLCELCSRERPDWRAVLRRQWPCWAMLAAGALFILLNARYFDLVSFGFSRRTLADNLLTQVGGVSYLALRLVSLHGYNIDPALPALTAWSAPLALQAALLAALALLGLANLRARPWIAFGVLWFFLQLAPTNSIVPRLDVANDRQLYLASWGLFFALCVQIAMHAKAPRWAPAALVLAFAATCIDRQLDYRSEIALWEADVASAPWNARARNNLGYAYQLAGRMEDARREYESALAMDSGHRKARFNLFLLGRN